MASLNDSSSSTTSTRVTLCPSARGVRGDGFPPGLDRYVLAAERDRQREGRSGALGAADGDPAVVRGGHMLDDGQPQASAAGGTGPGRVHPVEPLEDPLKV